jgi:beta-lactamase class A
MPTASQFCRTLFLSLVCSAAAFGQLSSARTAIDSIAGHAKGHVGVAAVDLGSGDSLTFRGDDHFPMQSVYKFPIALAVLDRVDRGTMTLSQAIRISKADLVPDTWSPLRNAYPAGNVDLPLDSLLKYTVSYSDNNGCDILLRLLGGTHVVDRYVRNLGISDMSIVATENEMHQGWEVQYRNWSSPRAMARLLQLYSDGGILSEASRNYLWQLMAATATAPGRIKGLLPPEAIVAHKSGSSGTNDEGLAAATNDIGIIAFPDGRRVALAVFVSDSDASDVERDAVIASIARAVWDAYASR